MSRDATDTTPRGWPSRGRTLLRTVRRLLLVMAWCIGATWAAQMIAAGIIGAGGLMALALLRIAVHFGLQLRGRELRMRAAVIFLIDLATIVGAVLLLAWAGIIGTGGGLLPLWTALLTMGACGVVLAIASTRAVRSGFRPAL